MTAPAPKRLLWLLAPVAAFAVTLALLAAVQGGGGAAPSLSSVDADIDAARIEGASTAELQQTLRDDPSNVAAYTALGATYLQRARETSDPAFYSRAEQAFDAARRLAPTDANAVIGLGTLALARHDFSTGLELGLDARRLAPESPRPLAVLADAQIELGRYAAAAQTLARMVALKPNLTSYARISYFRELHGDLAGAAQAMALAVSAGGGSPENVAYVRTLLGNLELQRGHAAAARTAYGEALAGLPTYLPAQAGLARIDAAAGRYAAAIARYRRVVTRRPLPEYAIALAEAELVAGRNRAARNDLDLVGAEAQLLRAAGVNVDVEIALFEADHGDPAQAVRLAQRALAAAPSVRSEDALGWALTRAGDPTAGLMHARRALRLGSADASFLYHAGVAARASGHQALGHTWLGRALAHRAALSPYNARRAEEALR
jgi:tetratricopeptide (TPR) repeat protein